MHSLKTEISEFDNRSFTSEEKTKGYLTAADQYDLDIRDIGKRINSLEQEYDGTSNSLLSSESKLCELEKELGKHEEEISALNRRQQLLEGDNKQSDEKVHTLVSEHFIIHSLKFYHSWLQLPCPSLRQVRMQTTS